MSVTIKKERKTLYYILKTPKQAYTLPNHVRSQLPTSRVPSLSFLGPHKETVDWIRYVT